MKLTKSYKDLLSNPSPLKHLLEESFSGSTTSKGVSSWNLAWSLLRISLRDSLHNLLWSLK